jgi:UDP-N-acetylglucosamine--N-acetylmuramyl-(pentapeptide) pyrophosphoryl-undecaprenol N-acetylglucosamine transferase
LLQLPLALWRAAYLLLKFRPDVVIGVGGYVSGPLLFAAALLRYRTLIWEPNAYPGLANRWLSSLVSQCLVVFDEAKKHLPKGKITKIHMPVRKEIEELAEILKWQDQAAPATFHVLVFGGSQGARAINNNLMQMVKKYSDQLGNIEIVHQTGPTDFMRIQNEYLVMPHAQQIVSVHEYLYDMPERLKWADLVIARSGTGTLSELAASGRPAILIPLPTAADDHQTQNAMALVQRGAAQLLPQKELTPERLFHEIMELKKESSRRKQMSENVRSFHKRHAADAIADLVLGK